MGDKGSLPGPKHFWGAAACAAASLGYSVARGEPPVRPAAGVIVIEYKEVRGSRVLYQDEKGGMVTPLAPPVNANTPVPINGAEPVEKPKSAQAPAKKPRGKAS